jgi:hypothetical protein
MPAEYVYASQVMAMGVAEIRGGKINDVGLSRLSANRRRIPCLP